MTTQIAIFKAYRHWRWIMPILFLIHSSGFTQSNNNCTPPAPNPLCTPPTTFDEDVTVATGTTKFWDEIITTDPQNIINKIRIKGGGKVIVRNNQNVMLKSATAVLNIENVEFIVDGGNLQLDVTGCRYLQNGGALRTYGNFQQTTQTIICITGTTIEIGEEEVGGRFNSTGNNNTAANWQNDGGYRYLKNNCINVTQDFQLQSTGTGTNINGVDVIIDCCIEIGDRGLNHATPTDFGDKDSDDSGNWQNSNSQSIYGTEIVVANGNFQNNQGIMTLCSVDIKVNVTGSFQINSGTLQGQNLCIGVEDIFENSATWTLTGINWYSEKQNSTNVPGAGTEKTKATVLACFDNNCCANLTACVIPSAIQLAKTAPTCTGATPSNNGKITLVSASNTDKCGISSLGATTYDGPVYALAVAYSANKEVQTAIPNTGGSYILRLFNGANNCFKDTTITITAVSCCTKPIASVLPKSQSTCIGGTVTAFTATPSTGVAYKWYGPLTDTTNSLGVAIAGQTVASYTPTGAALTTAGTKYYAIIVNLLGDVTCADTAFVQLIVPPKPTIALVNGFPACRQSGMAYSIKFVATGGTITTVPALAVTGDSIANVPLTTTSVKLIVTSQAGCKDSIEVSAPVCTQPVGSIGDLIWKDLNNNGLQDLPTEKGVSGVKVNLYSASGGTKTGPILQTKTTGGDGLYLFTGLLAGDYIVEIDKTTLPDTCQITSKQNMPSDDTKDSDFSSSTGLSQVITLLPVLNPTTPTEILATNNLTVDAGLVKVVPCIKPILILGGVVCNSNGTYSIKFNVSGGEVSSSVGTVSGNQIIDIPVGTNVVLTASNGLECTTTVTQQSPTACSENNGCTLPLLGVGQPICNGSTYSVAFIVDNGTVSTTAGEVSGNAVVGIPIGTDVTISASNSPTCISKVDIKSPTDCTTPCINADVSVSLPICDPANASTYRVNYIAGTGTTILTNVGTLGTNSITGIPSGTTLLLTIKTSGCADRTISITSPSCLNCVKPTVQLTRAPICSADAQTYSVTFSITGKNGAVKVDKGILTGNNPYTVTNIPSGETMKITDSLSSVCKFDTLITGVNCNCNPPLPTVLTPSMTVCVGDTFPTLRATVVGLATVEWFAQATGGGVLATGLNYKPVGAATAAGVVFYAQARSTDLSCPTAVSSSRVSVTINAQSCVDTVDLALKKSINTKIAQIGDVLTYTVKVWNEANVSATGVEVTDSIATTVEFLAGSFVPSRGAATITGNVIKWTIGNIGANGDTATLVYQIKATQQGIHFNTAEISKINEKDKDSSPNNAKSDEDDIDYQCFSVPILLCEGSKVETMVSANYTNVQWFKDGGSVPIASGNTVLLSEVGSYTFTAADQTCPTAGCCPIIIERGTNCCPTEKCVPLTIRKVNP